MQININHVKRKKKEFEFFSYIYVIFYVEKDKPLLGINTPPIRLRRNGVRHEVQSTSRHPPPFVKGI